MSSPAGKPPTVNALTKVTAADVYKKGRLGAHLVRDSGAVRFEYNHGYLAEAGPSIATTLPLAWTQNPD